MPAKAGILRVVPHAAVLCLYSGEQEARCSLYRSNLVARVSQHKERVAAGFTSRYFVKKLVYYEVFSEIEKAIAREKNIKAWKRDWKIEAIEKENPEWNDLFGEIAG